MTRSLWHPPAPPRAPRSCPLNSLRIKRYLFPNLDRVPCWPSRMSRLSNYLLNLLYKAEPARHTRSQWLRYILRAVAKAIETISGGWSEEYSMSVGGVAADSFLAHRGYEHLNSLCQYRVYGILYNTPQGYSS